MNKLVSWAHVAVGVLIALGAFGHSVAGVEPVKLALATVAAPTAALILAVWHFTGLCMVLLGGLAAWNGWQRRGTAVSLLPSLLIGLAYAGYGLATVLLIQQPFFWVFVVLGVALLACVAASRS